MKALLLCLALVATDGDTLTCTDGTKLRLGEGVDAPETKPRGGQKWGREAHVRLAELVEGQLLTCNKTGTSYERLVARCTLPDGRDVGSVMIAEGLATIDPRYGKARYLLEERRAACLGLGVWQGSYVPAYHWRECRDVHAPPATPEPRP